MTAAVGAAACAGVGYRAARAVLEDDASWRRTNFRGSVVNLFSGPAVTIGIVAGGVADRSGPGSAIAAMGAAAVGRLDDTRGTREEERLDKGLSGHWRALRSGRVSAGALKVVGLGVVGAAASLADGRRTRFDVVLDAACIAGTANLVNLLDLRPGRALKAGGLAAAVGSALGAPTAGLAGACVAMLPLDVRERSMLGDAGANAVGASLGASLVRRAPRLLRCGWLGLLTGATVASERVSFSAVIDSKTWLRRLDQLGRKPLDSPT